MTNPVDLAVGQRVRQLRRERRITQADLAESIGLTFQQVQKYERASNRISASKLVEIAGVLDVPVADLFTSVDDNIDPDMADDDLKVLLESVANMGEDMREHFVGLLGAIAKTN
ncbi:MAG: helix-turn-helix transcriptional regulator [Kordiimonadaceae bacterium]|nr:helix-turn-helix transcriptional regulator [Kordiimonadaceae bacterium]